MGFILLVYLASHYFSTAASQNLDVYDLKILAFLAHLNLLAMLFLHLYFLFDSKNELKVRNNLWCNIKCSIHHFRPVGIIVSASVKKCLWADLLVFLSHDALNLNCFLFCWGLFDRLISVDLYYYFYNS